MRGVVVGLLTLLSVLCASRGEAGTTAAVQTANGTAVDWRNTIGADQSASIGWSFSVGAEDLLVTALGIFDDGMDGMMDAHPVGIWTAGGTLLAQVTVPAGTAGTLFGSYRYTAVTPLTLTGGQTYVVGTYFGPVANICGSACGDVLLFNGPETYDQRLTFVQSRQTPPVLGSGSLALPNLWAGVAEGLYGPNILLEAPLAPTLTLSAGSLDFGSVLVGQPSGALTLTLGNSGTAALSLGALAISGAEAAEFELGNDTCSGQSLAPAASCSVDLTFTPAAPGPRTAQLDVVSNAASSPDDVALAGTGVQPAVVLSALAIDFGVVAVGQSSTTETVSVDNAGSADLVLGTLAISGAQAAEFALGNDTCSGQSLAPAASCSVELTLIPAAVGARTAQLDIPSNAPTSADDVTLAGTGVQAALALDLLAIDFGLLAPGDSASATVTITNGGDGDLVLDNLTAPVPPFAVTGGTCTTVPITLVPGTSCTLVVGLVAPATAGAYSAVVAIESNAPSSPDSITLNGVVLPVVAVPALDRWGLGLLVALLAACGWWLRRGGT